MALTKRQKQVMEFIARFLAEHGYSPSYEEIAAGLELASLATVHKHIKALVAKHYLKCGYNQSRSLELSPKYYLEQRRYRQAAGSLQELPLAGRIAAGRPVESVEGRETVDLGAFLSSRETYVLEVRGDSMIEDHICDGDFVIVQPGSEAKDGDIVVALVRGMETTLKRFYREADMARLQPANAAMEPTRVPLAEVQIQGRVLAVLRKYN
jgi:repressor LexA